MFKKYILTKVKMMTDEYMFEIRLKVISALDQIVDLKSEVRKLRREIEELKKKWKELTYLVISLTS